jgi:hypothetical protein
MIRDEWKTADWDNLKRPRFNQIGENQGVQATIAGRKRRAKAKGKRTNIQQITNRIVNDFETSELDVAPQTAAVISKALFEQALSRVLINIFERRITSAPATP